MAIKKIKDEYFRDAKVLSVTDGDTVVLDVDLGCDLRITMRCRMDGINAPEKNTIAGKEAKAYLTEFLTEFPNVVVKTIKDRKEKYGRYLVRIYIVDSNIDVNQRLIDTGHAVEYHGEKRI